MIKTLKIKDFIIIDELELEFDKGFNVITGETGAGKSIMINAIDLAFGARANKEVIKTGKQRAYIELTLLLDYDIPQEFLDDFGIENFGRELVISREITETSTRSRINGTLVTQDIIKAFREILIDIHNQHMTYTYIQPKYHITLLDSYGHESHRDFLGKYKDLYNHYVEVCKKLEKLQNSNTLTEQQADFLKFQMDEIEAAKIEDTQEDTKLAEELNVLANVEKLKELTYSAYWALYGEDGCIMDALGKVKTNISKATEMDSKLEEYETEIITSQEMLKELSSNLRNYAEALELDEQRLDEVQQRIDTLDKIKRKYGPTLEQVLENYAKFEEEYKSVEFSQDEIDKLQNQKTELKKYLKEAADLLSESRKRISVSLSEKIRNVLEMLDMPKVQFEIGITNCDFNTNGYDNVEFLISTNISEEPKPLAKIASGGEISRVMLALKTIFAKTDKINTVIFDEIDTGISGNACQAVAQVIKELSKTHQIISITHQPIIAAKADRHFYVTKSQDEQTKVQVHTLNPENRIKAIAMLAAGAITQDSLNFAKKLIAE